MITLVTKQQIIEQLVDIYFTYENWHTTKMEREQAIVYHTCMFDRNNIVPYIENNKVIGYVESWRINFEQFGRLVCHEVFNVDKENTTHGNIAYVANTWIHPEWRKSYVSKTLRNSFFLNNYMCQYFVGSALRKKTQPIKVFCKDNLMSRLFKGDE